MKTLDLNKLVAHPVEEHEELWEIESELSRYHPLGHRKAIGRRIYYEVKHRRERVAVLLFDGAVCRNNMRESRIGWSDIQRKERVCHISNNSRFLVLPEYEGVLNLASKCLSLVSERISNDWLKKYGIPILALETYVNPEHNNNEGSCYKGAGWEYLGISTGYKKEVEERTSGKLYFLKELNEKSYEVMRTGLSHALITGVKLVSGESNNNYILDTTKIDMKSLQKALEEIPDPRGGQGVMYKFIPLLSMCICALISGYSQYREIALWIANLKATERVYFRFRGDRIPKEGTISYLMRRIDTVKLGEVLSKWLLNTYGKEVNLSTILIDGKMNRGTSSDPKEQKSFLNIFANEIGIVINQMPTTKGGGEKKTVSEYLDSDVDLADKIIIADAINTDKKVVSQIVKKKVRFSSLSKVINES